MAASVNSRLRFEPEGHATSGARQEGRLKPAVELVRTARDDAQVSAPIVEGIAIDVIDIERAIIASNNSMHTNVAMHSVNTTLDANRINLRTVPVRLRLPSPLAQKYERIVIDNGKCVIAHRVFSRERNSRHRHASDARCAARRAMLSWSAPFASVSRSTRAPSFSSVAAAMR